MMRFAGLLSVSAGLVLGGCATDQSQEDRMDEVPPQIVLGNGEYNKVQLQGATRNGSVMTFPSVTIARDGFVVMHPFRDEKPVRNEYVGATLVRAGTTSNVTVDVGAVPQTGQNFIVMLHNDMNSDGVFDFGDGVTVPDEPTFEGNRLVALPFAAPAD